MPRSPLPYGAHVSVVVPAANEQALLAGCLDALDRARALLHAEHAGRVTSSVTVVLDACTDGTHQVAERYPVRLVHVGHRNVGAARAAGCAAALAGDRPWILANTDADSRVPVHWLTRAAAHVRDGADVVLGTVRPGPGLAAAEAAAWDAEHKLGPGHRHVHGANLVLTADAYLRLGGWDPVPTGEDVALVRRARCSRARVIAVDDAPVLTSSRLGGRAPSGFSSYLRGLGAATRAAGAGGSTARTVPPARGRARGDSATP